jgi:hypothetical protein
VKPIARWVVTAALFSKETGASGILEQRIYTSEERALNPTTFLAATLNLY